MNEKTHFLDELHSGVLIGDGALGTELFSRGAMPHTGVERMNLTAPGIVENLHREYVAAGSRVIETNTFGANRLNLQKYQSGHETKNIILAGVRLARNAAGSATYVAGSVGPLPFVDGEPLSDSEQTGVFTEVITSLLDGEVDLLIFETFIDLTQLVTAVRIARSLTGLPVVAQMAFEEGGILPGGESIEQFVRMCTDAGADVVGANCGAGISSIRDAIVKIAPYGVPMSAYLNAGFAEQVEGRHLYVAPAEYLSETACELVRMGVRLVGGCCGTGPETIRAMAKALTGVTVTWSSSDVEIVIERDREPSRIFVSPVSVPPAKRPEEIMLSPVPSVPRGILVELDPPKNLDISPLVTAARMLMISGVSAVTLADNPLASVRVDVLSVAGLLNQKTGIPVIPHITGRDRNRIALQSAIMGAHVQGIRALLCVTGDPVRMYHESNTSGVFDVTSVGLVKLVAEFNSGHRLDGRERTAFSIGVALNPNVRSIGGQINKLERKIEAGAHFTLTQPIFTMKRLDMLQKALDDARINLPVFIGIMPIISARNADYLHNEVPGMYIPDEYRNRIKQYEKPEDQRSAGLEIAVELVEQFAPRVHGVYIITPRNRAEYVLPVIEAAKRKLSSR